MGSVVIGNIMASHPLYESLLPNSAFLMCVCVGGGERRGQVVVISPIWRTEFKAFRKFVGNPKAHREW